MLLHSYHGFLLIQQGKSPFMNFLIEVKRWAMCQYSSIYWGKYVI